MKGAPAVILAILLAAGAAGGETILTAEIDRDSITVGDPILLTVGTAGRGGEAPVVPAFPEGKVGPFEILESLPVERETRDGVTTAVARFRITAFETGDLEIPPITPPDGGTGSDPIPVAVVSVGVDAGGDLRDVKRPLSLGRDRLRTLLFPALSALLLAAALAFWLRWRRRGVLPDPVLGPLDLRSAHVIAYEALRALEEARLAGGSDRPYWFHLSAVAREYLDRRFRVPAPERTSRETLRLLRSENLDTEATGLLRDLFAASDLAKFRGILPGEGEAAAAAERARRFVDLTRERGPKGEGTGEEGPS